MSEPTQKQGLTADKARKVIEANAVNLARKVVAGETLKGGELAIMQQIAASADVALGVEWVKNQTALAALLGTTRRTLNRWAKVEGVPRPASDGRLNVPAWREWMKANGHVTKDATAAGGRMAELRERQLERSVEILEVKLAELRGDVIQVATVEGMLSELGATIMALLRQKLENEWPISCAGLEPAQVRVRGKALVDDIAVRLQKAVEPWRKT